MTQVLDLVPIWTLILALAVFFYVLLDGFDLGVGMLYGLAPDARSRNTIMNSIAPIWDGNETWLVLGPWPSRGLPDRLRGDHFGSVFPHSGDGPCTGVPRRRIRIPVSRR